MNVRVIVLLGVLVGVVHFFAKDFNPRLNAQIGPRGQGGHSGMLEWAKQRPILTIFDAIFAQNMEEVKKFVESDPKLVHQPYEDSGKTPLMMAAGNGDDQIVAYLLEKGADPKAEGPQGSTALHAAGSFGALTSKPGGNVGSEYPPNPKIAELLIEKGADVNAKNDEGKTPLFNVIMGGSLEVVKVLVKHGADVNVKTSRGQTPLALAIATNHSDIVEFLMANGAKDGGKNIDGSGSLHSAARNGNLDLLKKLFASGADPNALDQEGHTPLHIAAEKSLEVVQFLLDHGAKPDPICSHGNTPFHKACLRGNASVAMLLISKGADMHRLTKGGATALHCAASSGNLELINYFLDKGFDPKAKDSEGGIPFKYALRDASLPILEKLWVEGFDVNAPLFMEYRPLFLAVERRKADVVRFLISKGASTDIKVYSGKKLMDSLDEMHLPEEVRDALMSTSTGTAPIDPLSRFKGAEEAKALLKANGFVVTGPEFRQLFEAYVKEDLPFFITTDSAWHAYHVLLESALRHLENRQAEQLKIFLTSLHGSIQQHPDKDSKPMIALRWVTEVGLGLLSTDHKEASPAFLPETMETIKQIQSGNGLCQGPIGFPVEVSTLRPAGFYSSDKSLGAYFTSRKWLSTVIFRADNAFESETAFRFALLLRENKDLLSMWQELDAPYEAFLGKSDDGKVSDYIFVAEKVLARDVSAANVKSRIVDLQTEVQKVLPTPRVNDQAVDPHGASEPGQLTKGLRLFPARNLPCAELFQKTTSPSCPGRNLPSGLDFFAFGPLASKAGRDALKGTLSDQVLFDKLEKVATATLSNSFHDQAMGLLGELQKPPEGLVEPLFKTSAWADRQLWTQLGAWSEQRHTWVLHVKSSMSSLGMMEFPAGTVEPYPQFFRGLGKLVSKTSEVVKPWLKTIERPPASVALELLEDLEATKEWHSGGRPPSPETLTPELERRLQRLSGPMMRGFDLLPQKGVLESSEVLVELQSRMKAIASGKAPDRVEELVLKEYSPAAPDLEKRFELLASVCATLGDLAEKHVKGVALAPEDEQFIRSYGATLGYLQFYEGNTYLGPRDDFPMVTPVFWDLETGQSLYCGVGKPEAIYVLLPVRGKPVLHRGAILSYREAVFPMTEPMNDDIWMGKARMSGLPQPPVFTRSFRIAATTSPQKHLPLEDAEKEGQESGLQGIDDPGKLFDSIEAMSDEAVDDAARKLIQLKGETFTDRCVTLLKNASMKKASVGAKLLSISPGAIPYEALIKDFDQQPPSHQRLRLFLLGMSPKSTPSILEVFHKSLSSSDQGVRFQAIVLLAKVQWSDSECRKAIMKLVDDPNDYVAAAAISALCEFHDRDAVSVISSKMKDYALKHPNGEDPDYPGLKDVLKGTRFSGMGLLMVLDDGPCFDEMGTPKSLPAALRKARAVFGISK